MKTKSVKALMLSTSYPITAGSVSGLFVRALARSLTKSLRLSVVVPGAHNGDDASAGEVNLVSFRYAPKKFQLLAHSAGGIPEKLRESKLFYALLPAFMLSYLIAALREGRGAKLVHANWAFSSVIGVWVKWLYRIPLVTTLRGEDVAPKGFVSRLILWWSVYFSDQIVLVSDEMREMLAAKYNRYSHKFITIYNGVCAAFSSTNKSQDFYTEGPLRLAFVGSLVPRKNCEYLLRAIADVVSSGVDCRLTIIGDGSCRQTLEKQVESDALGKHVEFLGVKMPAEVAGVLADAHVYVSASRHEGRPNSVLEAMASGCCCVLSDISGHRELAADACGELFSLEGCADFVKLIQALDQDRRKAFELGKSAQMYIEREGLTWEGCASHYLNVFERVCAEA